MRNMKKLLLTLIAMLSMVFAMQVSTMAAPVKPYAAKIAVETGETGIGVTYVGAVSKLQCSALQFQLIDMKSKKVLEKSNPIARTGYVFNTKIKANKLYGVKIRSAIKVNGSYKYSAWSNARYGVYADPTVKIGTNTTFKLTFPKANKICGYMLYTSENEENGYKKVGTINVSQGAKTVTISKIAGKKLISYKNYYFKIVPLAKIGGSTVKANTTIQGYYIKTVYA